jgi:hypothetical protein
MILKLPVAQILGAVIVLIALCFAPSTARAHAGHHHGAVATSSSDVSPLAGPTAGVVKQAIAEAASYSPDEIQVHCVGGCCSNAQCAACGLALGSAVPEVVPLNVSVRTLFPDVTIKSGLGPQDLTRPPRSFV